MYIKKGRNQCIPDEALVSQQARHKGASHYETTPFVRYCLFYIYQISPSNKTKAVQTFVYICYSKIISFSELCKSLNYYIHYMDKEKFINDFTNKTVRSNEFKKLIKVETDKLYVLFNKDHDTIGSILKYHLIVEYVLNEYIKYHYSDVIDIQKIINLSFEKKIYYFKKDEADLNIIHALKQFNSIRNKLSHDIYYKLKKADVHLIDFYVNKIKSSKNKINKIDKLLFTFAIQACGYILGGYGKPREVYLEKLNVEINKYKNKNPPI